MNSYLEIVKLSRITIKINLLNCSCLNEELKEFFPIVYAVLPNYELLPVGLI
jgi:hypothetical protein